MRADRSHEWSTAIARRTIWSHRGGSANTANARRSAAVSASAEASSNRKPVSASIVSASPPVRRATGTAP